MGVALVRCALVHFVEPLNKNLLVREAIRIYTTEIVTILIVSNLYLKINHLR